MRRRAVRPLRRSGRLRRLARAGAVALAVAACNAESGDLRLVGTVERTLVEVVSPVAEELLALEVERGQRVDEGDVIARLDATLAAAESASAHAELAGARTAAVVSRHDYERSLRLRGEHVVSEQQLEVAELARDEAGARLLAAEARAAAARKRVADHTITSPVSGVVDQIPFDEGERVPAGAVVAVIQADGAPWVRVWLPEPAYARVPLGKPADVIVDGVGRPLRGRVAEVSREPEFTPHFALTERDRVHLVYETRVEIEDAPATLRAGAPAEVAIRLDAAAGGEGGEGGASRRGGAASTDRGASSERGGGDSP